MVGSLSRKNNKISHKVKKDLRTNSTSSYPQFTVKSLTSLFISTVRFGFVLLICQKIFNLFFTRLNQIKRFLSFSMVSEEYRRAEASSSVTLNETSKPASRTTPTRIMLDDETVQKYRKKLETLSSDERKDEFVKEKNQGNECFNRSRYELAIQHYTRCILCDPQSDVAYSNRALSFLKMNKYTQALEDCNEALRIEPRNVKAKYRRGLALHHKNMFYAALQDFEDVVRNETNNFIANHYVSKLRELLNSQPKKIMLLSSEPSSQGGGKSKVIHIPERDYHLNPKYRHCIQVNEWGLVKPFCSCNNGEPEFIRQHRRQMETQRRKQRETLAMKSSSDSHLMNNVNNNQQEVNTNESNPNKVNSSQYESNTNKLNSKQADESVNILAKGLMKSLSKEITPPEPELVTDSGSILKSKIVPGEPVAHPEIESGSECIVDSKPLTGEQITQPETLSESGCILESKHLSEEAYVQTRSIPLIRNMPLLGDETTEIQVEPEQNRNKNDQVESVVNNSSSSVANEKIVQGTHSQQVTGTLGQQDTGTLGQQDTGTLSQQVTGTLSQQDTGTLRQQVTGTKSQQERGTHCPVEREQPDNQHVDCIKADIQPKPNKLNSNRPTVNCNGIDNELGLGNVKQQKTEKEIENKLILESGKKNKLKTNDQTCAENLKQNKVKNIFTIVKSPNKMDHKQNIIPVETRSEPIITTNCISLETTEKPVEVMQTNLTNTDNQSEPAMRGLTKSQKRQIRRRNCKKQSQDGDGEQNDNGTVAETINHIEDNPGNKVSTKSKKDIKINDTTKPQPTASDATTNPGEKKRLKRKISNNSNKPKPNETDIGQGTGDSGLLDTLRVITKQAEQVFKKYEDKTYPKLIEQKTTKSETFSNANCQETGHSEEPIGKRCSNKKVNEEDSSRKNEYSRKPVHKQGKVNKLLKSNQPSKTSSNKVVNKTQAKDSDTAMLTTPGKGSNIMNGHHVAGEGDFYH